MLLLRACPLKLLLLVYRHTNCTKATFREPKPKEVEGVAWAELPAPSRMAQTPLIGGQYEQIRTLGRGTYGLVVLAMDVNSGEQVKPFLTVSLLFMAWFCLLHIPVASPHVYGYSAQLLLGSRTW